MRAVIDLMRENEDVVQDNLRRCEGLLKDASKQLMIVDLAIGEEELFKSVAAELAKVTALMAENSQRQ